MSQTPSLPVHHQPHSGTESLTDMIKERVGNHRRIIWVVYHTSKKRQTTDWTKVERKTT